MALIDHNEIIKRIRAKATVTLSVEQDDTPIEGNASATDDPEDDAEIVRVIRKRLERGDDWAWCVVTVTATLGPWSSQDSLHGCNYRDERDFRSGGYYEDMVEIALDSLATELLKSIHEIEKLGIEVSL
jgi:hypothetical protein